MATTIEQVGRRLYLVGLPFAAKDAAKSALGMTGDNFDRERKQWWCGTAKREDAEKFVASINAAPVKETPDQIRLTGKGRYKGREYYAGAVRNGRVRLLTLPDDKGEFLDFWADCSQVEQTKEYPPREVWDGVRNSGRTVTKYTTLGSIAAFIAKQKRADAQGVPQCPCCSYRGELVEDLEDGLMKCAKCCDMPAN